MSQAHIRIFCLVWRSSCWHHMITYCLSWQASGWSETSVSTRMSLAYLCSGKYTSYVSFCLSIGSCGEDIPAARDAHLPNCFMEDIPVTFWQSTTATSVHLVQVSYNLEWICPAGAFVTVNDSRIDVLRITRRAGSHYQGSTFSMYRKNYVNFPHASARDQGYATLEHGMIEDIQQHLILSLTCLYTVATRLGYSHAAPEWHMRSAGGIYTSLVLARKWWAQDNLLWCLSN